MTEKIESITMSKAELIQLLNEASEKSATEAATKATEAFKTEASSTKKFASSYKGAFADMDETTQKGLEMKSKMSSFIKAIYHKDASSLGMFKSLTESTGANGGFLVPEEFATEVNRVIEDFGLVAKMARKFPMISDTLNVPRLSSSVSVSYPGEINAAPQSKPVFESVTLLAKTLVGITPMSNELLADANVSVVDLLIELFGEAIGGKLDEQGLTGTGTPFVGILADTSVTVFQPANGNSTFVLAATTDNARQMIAQVKPWSLQGAAFIMHRAIWALIQITKASTGGEYFVSAANPVLTPNNQAQGYPSAMAGTLWGYPVYLSDKMPSTTAVSTKFIIFGNLKHLYMGMREEMGVSISQDASLAGGINLFEMNMSAVRVTARHALAVGLPSCFVVLRTSAA